MTKDAGPPADINVSKNVDDIKHNVADAERDGFLISEVDGHGYRVKEQPYGTKRHMRLVLTGVGAATAGFLRKAEDTMSDIAVSVYEKHKDVGGTWFENRYPGCDYDIPFVSYQYSWNPKIWTQIYLHSPEMWQYLNDIYNEHHFVSKHTKLCHNRAEAGSSRTGQMVKQPCILAPDCISCASCSCHATRTLILCITMITDLLSWAMALILESSTAETSRIIWAA